LIVAGDVVVINIYALVIVANTAMEFPLEKSRLRKCGDVACLVNRTSDMLMITIRFAGECLEIFASAVYFTTLHFHKSISRARNIVCCVVVLDVWISWQRPYLQKTRLVKFMLISEILISSIPICISEACAVFFHIQTTNYVGGLIPFLVRTDCFLAASAYYWALRRRVRLPWCGKGRVHATRCAIDIRHNLTTATIYVSGRPSSN